jgi:hypothetical protein
MLRLSRYATAKSAVVYGLQGGRVSASACSAGPPWGDGGPTPPRRLAPSGSAIAKSDLCGCTAIWSQIHGLGANVVIPGLESITCDDVHSDTQEVLQILEQTDVIKEGRAWLEIHEQIYIAVWMSLASSD